MLIASRGYTAAQHDTGAAEENQQQAKQLHEEQPERKSPLATQNTAPSSASLPKSKSPSYLQNSSRYLLGFPLKLSHASLQVQVPKSIKWPPSLSPFFRRV
jgi:hypothetical protein